MIHIITGQINTGKTTKTLKHYERHHQGDGFVSLKFMVNNRVDHYEIMKLSTHEQKVLMIHQDSLQKTNDDSALHIGPYHCITQSMVWVEEEIKQMIGNKVSPIYLDEIGGLELHDQGFHQILTEMMDSKLDLVLVIRDAFLTDVITKYQMHNIQIV